jgi:hypothetical protein
MASSSQNAWRLLPSERVLWRGGPRLGVPRDLRWSVTPLLCVALALVAALFAGLLHVSGIPAVRPTAFVAFYFLLLAVAVHTAPKHLFDTCEYMVTDRQVIWRRGGYRRTIDRRAITYARVHWHRSVPGVGHLELVRAVPFGPLARKQRMVLHDVEAPDRLFALIREAEPTEHAGDGAVSLIDRLDRGETVVWGAGPEGWRLGHAEAATATIGSLVLGAGVVYAYRTGGILVALESIGLPVRSWTWLMLFLAIFITCAIVLGVGAVLVWHGIVRARAEGLQTEYILTDSRLLIRRGRTELSVDRRRIVDVADLPSSAGSHNLHLILDAPNARALDDSGALSMFPPPRALVAPVLYEVTEPELVRSLLFERRSDPHPPLDRAA